MPARILVVHSDPGVISRVGCALSSGRSKPSVQAFTAGREALRWLEANPDGLRLVLVGGALRDPDPGELVSGIRSQARLRRLPIVLMPDAPAGVLAGRGDGAWANGRLLPCAEDAAFDAMVRTVADYWARWNTPAEG